VLRDNGAGGPADSQLEFVYRMFPSLQHGLASPSSIIGNYNSFARIRETETAVPVMCNITTS
jgi:hypothetical protein